MVVDIVSAVKNVDWKSFVKGPVFIAIVAGLCFWAGRSTAPENTKVVTVDKIVETRHEQTQVAQQINIDELLKKVQDKTRYVIRDVVKEVTIKPDGTRIETETDKSRVDSTQRTTTDSETKKTEVSEIKKFLDSYKTEEHTKTVVTESAKKWRLGILGGYSKNSSGHLTNTPGLIVGAYGERSILGPINVGAWINSQPGAGLQFSVSF
jgi:hypothetical protein